MCSSMWNVTLCDMKIKLKQLRVSMLGIFCVKIVLKVFKNHPKGPFINKCEMCWNANLKKINENLKL
jgi:hypothetical protein